MEPMSLPSDAGSGATAPGSVGAGVCGAGPGAAGAGTPGAGTGTGGVGAGADTGLVINVLQKLCESQGTVFLCLLFAELS